MNKVIIAVYFSNAKFVSNSGFSCLLPESVSQVSIQHDLRCHVGSSGRAAGRTTSVLVSEKII